MDLINIREIIRRFNDSTPLKYRAVLSLRSEGASLLLSNLPGTPTSGGPCLILHHRTAWLQMRGKRGVAGS
jgi:hypothetical protein